MPDTCAAENAAIAQRAAVKRIRFISLFLRSFSFGRLGLRRRAGKDRGVLRAVRSRSAQIKIDGLVDRDSDDALVLVDPGWIAVEQVVLFSPQVADIRSSGRIGLQERSAVG